MGKILYLIKGKFIGENSMKAIKVLSNIIFKVFF